MKPQDLTRRKRKALVRRLVAERDIDVLLDWSTEDERVVEGLCGLLYEPDDLERWRAIDALGRVAASVAKTDIETIRDRLRRLLWSMNDESGGAGWHSPEAIGAIVANIPSLIDDFGILLGSFLNEAPLERGAHWGVAAIAPLRPDAFRERVPELTESLNSADPYIRWFALLALAAIGTNGLPAAAEAIAHDSSPVELYYRDLGDLRSTTVGELALLVRDHIGVARPAISVW